MSNINTIYKKHVNLYDNSFLLEYKRVMELTKKINDELGFPVFKIRIDAINSELKVENRFAEQKSKNKFKNMIKISGMIYAR